MPVLTHCALAPDGSSGPSAMRCRCQDASLNRRHLDLPRFRKHGGAGGYAALVLMLIMVDGDASREAARLARVGLRDPFSYCSGET
jgi:hypothetical protein